MTLPERVLEYITEHVLFGTGDTVLCALSGGADSVCMLHVLLELGYSVDAAHYNHRLRGDESDGDESFVRELCAALGVRLTVGSGDVAAYALEGSMGTEEAARELRYAFLERTAAELGIAVIATAHNAGDNAETMLFNLARGSGTRGLAGIPPLRILPGETELRIVRPLLCTTRDEIERWLDERGIAHVEDSSNASDAYSRNRIRHRVLPPLRELNREFERHALSAAEYLREDDEYLTALAANFIAEHLADGALPREELAALPNPLFVRVLRSFTGILLGGTHVTAIRRLLVSEKAHGELHLPETRLRISYSELRIAAPDELLNPGDLDNKGSIPETVVDLETITHIPGTNFHLSCNFIEKCSEIHKSFNNLYFQSKSICGTVKCRSRKVGDTLRLAGRRSRSLKKLFSEAKIPPEARDNVPVLADEQGVIAVLGFGVAERCSAYTKDSDGLYRNLIEIIIWEG